MDDPDQLRAAGRLAEAAAVYRVRGDLARAETIYAELWDFRTAADVAHERGDRPAELGHLLAANDLPSAAIVGLQIEGGAPDELRRAAAVYERNRRWLSAATLRERVGELETARELYRRAQSLLDVARLERALGRLREAGLAYEQLVQQDPDGAELARLELGRLLLTLDRPEEAARHLQAALRGGVERTHVARALVVALDRLGYRGAADEIATITQESRASIVASQRQSSPGPTRLAGRYEIEKLLGAGASGRVFLASDVMSGRSVAVKLLTPATDARNNRARLFAEARLVATIRHPNVVEVLDANEALGLVVMEFVTGGTLLDRIGRPLAQRVVRRLVLDVLDALAVIHARGIVHRDLKPANLFYGATGEVKVGDFGAAHLFAEEATQTAGFVGTLAYMAPEQMTGANVGFAADVYALGAIAFHALTGRLPFAGPDFVGQHLGEIAPSPSSVIADLRAWDPIIAAMMQKSPDARPQAVDDLRRRVAQIALPDEATRTPSIVEAPIAIAQVEERFVPTSTLPDATSLGVDRRLGRSVVIETLTAAHLASDDGTRHVQWLKSLAKLGGPRLQRLFALEPRDDGGLDAIFEALAPGSPPTSLAPLRSTLAALHAAGIAHGSLRDAIVYESHGPMIVVAGFSPRADATVADDLAELA